VCISLNDVLTAVVSSAILSVMISSSTFILVSNPSVVLSRHPVMSWRIASIYVMCLRVWCIVVSFAII
jgi:uncharacterized MnhB-related membrane protein